MGLKKNIYYIYLPVISKAAVKCDVGGPASPVAPRAAPPSAQAKPHRATTKMTARNGGPANHFPQQPFPDRSEGDLQRKEERILLALKFTIKKCNFNLATYALISIAKSILPALFFLI